LLRAGCFLPVDVELYTAVGEAAFEKIAVKLGWSSSRMPAAETWPKKIIE
jgi:hypothetical protein